MIHVLYSTSYVRTQWLPILKKKAVNSHDCNINLYVIKTLSVRLIARDYIKHGRSECIIYNQEPSVHNYLMLIDLMPIIYHNYILNGDFESWIITIQYLDITFIINRLLSILNLLAISSSIFIKHFIMYIVILARN